MRRVRLSFVGILAVTAAVVGAVAVPAFASYPGGVGRIAFGMAGPEGNGNLYSVLPKGRGLRRLTDDPFTDLCPAYSPGSRQIAFCSDRTGAFEIWAINRGGGEQHPVTSLGGYAVFPDYSPDGRRIAFTGDEGPDRNDEVYVVNARASASSS